MRVPWNLDARKAHYAVLDEHQLQAGSNAYTNWVRAYDTLDEVDLIGMQELARSLGAGRSSRSSCPWPIRCSAT